MSVLSPQLSVVVCTRDRAALAAQCVASLVAQRGAAGTLEILVVDSASRPADRAILAGLTNAAAGVRSVREDEPGLSRARNRGWREARAELVAYVDDDAVAERQWLAEALAFHARQPTVAAFGGPYSALHEGTPPAWMPPNYGALDLGPHERPLRIGREWLTGTNMVFTRELLAELGGFDERLGMIGSRVAYGEETQLQARIARRGTEVWWVPSVRVAHRVALVKYSMVWNLRATWQTGRAYAALGAAPELRGLIGHGIRSSKRLLEVRRAFAVEQGQQPGPNAKPEPAPKPVLRSEMRSEMRPKPVLGAPPWSRRGWHLLEPCAFVGGIWGEIATRVRSRAAATVRRAESSLRRRVGAEPGAVREQRAWRARVTPLFPAGGLRDVRDGGEPGLVSVVVPVWNGARELAEALESILGQSYARLEVVAVDDGSTDATPEILAAFASRDPRLRVIRQDNQKLPAALNRGFAAARGEFLTWASHDNRWHPSFLEVLVGFLQRRPEVDLANADIELIGEDGQRLVDSPIFWADQWPPGSGLVRLPHDRAELASRRNVLGLAFLWRDRVRAVLGGFDRARFGVEDWDFAMRADLLLNVAHVDSREPLLAFRLRRGSLTDRADELGIAAAGQALLAEGRRRREALERALGQRASREGLEVDPSVRHPSDLRLRLYRELAIKSGLRVTFSHPD